MTMIMATSTNLFSLYFLFCVSFRCRRRYKKCCVRNFSFIVSSHYIPSINNMENRWVMSEDTNLLSCERKMISIKIKNHITKYDWNISLGFKKTYVISMIDLSKHYSSAPSIKLNFCAANVNETQIFLPQIFLAAV